MTSKFNLKVTVTVAAARPPSEPVTVTVDRHGDNAGSPRTFLFFSGADRGLARSMPGGTRRAGVVSSHVNKMYGRGREEKPASPRVEMGAPDAAKISQGLSNEPLAGRRRATAESVASAIIHDISLSDSSDDDLKPIIARPATAGQLQGKNAKFSEQQVRSAVRIKSPVSLRTGPLDSSFTTDDSVTSSPTTPRFRNRCRWNQEPDSKRKCKGSATVLQRNGGVCESCQTLRSRWTARLVAEFPTVMSRSQLSTLLDKHMDLNRCRLILEVYACSHARPPARAVCARE